MRKVLFISFGFLFVALGVFGIFLPIMPTTIFLIIASYFFMKSSPELYEKLLNNKYLGKYIKDYKEKRYAEKSKNKCNFTSLDFNNNIRLFFYGKYLFESFVVNYCHWCNKLYCINKKFKTGTDKE